MTIYNKKIVAILVLSFTLLLSFGMASMHMDDKGNMSDCLFIGSDAICQMSFSEHIATFQSIFRAVPSRTVLLLILVLALLLILYSKLVPRIYSPPELRFFLKNDPEPHFVNKLLSAFSDGIIQPKLYA